MPDLAKNQLHIVLVNGVVEKNGLYLIAQRSLEESQMAGWNLGEDKIIPLKEVKS